MTGRQTDLIASALAEITISAISLDTFGSVLFLLYCFIKMCPTESRAGHLFRFIRISGASVTFTFMALT